jgi:hypothetical protein
MTITYAELDGVPVTICRGPEMKERHRDPMGVKWCFKCRGRHEFDWIVMGADMALDDDGQISPSMYMAEPTAHSECSGCGRRDGQLFPGWSYRWEDE